MNPRVMTVAARSFATSPTLHARAEGGTVVWPNEQDICPDTLYEELHEARVDVTARGVDRPRPSERAEGGTGEDGR